MNITKELLKIAIDVSKDKIQVEHGRILLGNKEVGHLFSYETKATKEEILSYFNNDNKIMAYLNSLDLPKRISYIWIDELFIKNAYRDRKYGTEALIVFMNAVKKPCLISLQPGELVKSSVFEKLVAFYKKMGFKLITSKDGTIYAFKFHK